MGWSSRRRLESILELINYLPRLRDFHLDRKFRVCLIKSWISICFGAGFLVKVKLWIVLVWNYTIICLHCTLLKKNTHSEEVAYVSQKNANTLLLSTFLHLKEIKIYKKYSFLLESDNVVSTNDFYCFLKKE